MSRLKKKKTIGYDGGGGICQMIKEALNEALWNQDEN